MQGGFHEKFEFSGALGGGGGNEGINGEGMCGQLASGDVGCQGIDGCASLGASRHVGDIPEGREGIDAQGSKGKRGRAKGSKKKPMPIAEAGAIKIAEVRVGNGEDRSGGAQGSKGKRGRPKGSKSKPKPITEAGGVNVGGEESATPKRKLGRPKGSKNKKKALGNGEKGGGE